MNVDSIEEIKQIDRDDMLGNLENFPRQCEEAVKIGDKLSLREDYSGIDNIVITGLGGSAMGGDILSSYLADELRLPVYVNRDYFLPAFVDENSLVVTVSYSGNTEETLSAYTIAVERKAKIIGITSGGKLLTLCRDSGRPAVVVPGGLPPRAALGYLFFSALIIMKKLSFIKDKTEEIGETIELLEDLAVEYSPASALSSNPAKALACDLQGKLPIIYSASRRLGVITARWRTQINENSKSLIFNHVFPEMNHNEIVGWGGGPRELTKNFAVVVLRDSDDYERIKKRIEITKKVIANEPAFIREVHSRGKGLLARLFSLIYLGDFVSFYLACLYEVDPTPVERIAILKRELAK